MKLTTVLFDLDGTLLPMDQDTFVGAYFRGLSRTLAPYGYDPEALVRGIWAGTGAMVKNDGSITNEEAFWRTFAGLFGEKARQDEPVFARFYATEFQKVQQVCGFSPEAARTVKAIKALGLDVVLATNPIFPAIATHSRARWAGLDPEDFRLITTYENSRYCKPNPEYYRQILRELELEPEECLMVGNDVSEDMIAGELGMEVFLLPACLINKGGQETRRYPQGDFGGLLCFIRRRLELDDMG